MAPTLATYHLTTLLNLTLTLTPTLTTSTRKWFSVITVAGTSTMKLKSKSRRAEMWVQDKSWDVGSSRTWTSTCGSRFVGDERSGGTCLKSSRRLSTKMEGERRKRGRKKGRWRNWEKDLGMKKNNKEEKETRHKHNRSKFHNFFCF